MELVKQGKTKDVFKLPDGNYLLKFKDTVTGHASGESDPGGNTVVGSVAGVGSGALKMSVYYFELLKKNGIATHYVNANISRNEMTVSPAQAFGSGLEFVMRYKASGSFVKRFGLYCRDGDALHSDKCPGVFEATLKDDAHDDPPVTDEILAALGLLTPAQFEEIRQKTVTICGIIKNDLAGRRLDLFDIKIEFGIINGEIALIDEISAGNMRVFCDGKKLDYLTLCEKLNAE